MKKLIFTMLSISLALTACQNLEKELDQERVYDKKITFYVSDFEINDSFDTRTAIVSGNKFIWTANDTVGIFPNNGSQVFFYSFPMSLRHSVTCTHIYLDTPTQYKYAHIHTYTHVYILFSFQIVQWP